MKLDTTKKFGTIGGPHGVAKYEQGGKFFDAQGNLLDDEGSPLKGAAAAATSLVNDEDKDSLIAEARALGIKANSTWGLAKLKDVIAKAKGSNTDQVAAALAGE